MIKLENTEVVGWEHAIRGMRNPMNSWNRSDSRWEPQFDTEQGPVTGEFVIGPNDHELMMKLARGGPVHAKYRRMIVVYVDITAPLYWWKEMDQYRIGQTTNSCSTMHKIAAKEFTMEDFSCEHLTPLSLANLTNTINILNIYRNTYLYGGEDLLEDGSKIVYEHKSKDIWWQMIQLLPSSYNQRRTVMLNYEVLHNIYISRKDHKLDEWRDLCEWIKSLPYSELITLDE